MNKLYDVILIMIRGFKQSLKPRILFFVNILKLFFNKRINYTINLKKIRSRNKIMNWNTFFIFKW